MNPFAIRMHVLRAALEDTDTRIALNLARNWEEGEKILADFARKKGFKVVEMKP